MARDPATLGLRPAPYAQPMVASLPRRRPSVGVFTLLLVAWALLAGCQNPLPTFPTAAASDPSAKAVIERAAEAHGGLEAFRAVEGVAAGFAGEWLDGIHRLQPVLVDRNFRSVSRERYLFRERAGEGENKPLPHPAVGQRHDGEGGSKWVRWQGAAAPVGVAYRGRNGEPVAPHGRAQEVTEASALVAEAYRMFLTGPFFFLERDERAAAETDYAPADPAEVAGVACEQVLVRIRPGLGISPEDRVLVAVGGGGRAGPEGPLLASGLLGHPGRRRRGGLRRLGEARRDPVADAVRRDGDPPAGPGRPPLGDDRALGAAHRGRLGRTGGRAGSGPHAGELDGPCAGAGAAPAGAAPLVRGRLARGGPPGPARGTPGPGRVKHGTSRCALWRFNPPPAGDR